MNSYDPNVPHAIASWDQPTYVLVVGPHSSGKSTLARALARDLGGASVEMGDVVRSEAHALHHENLVQLAEDIMNADPLYIARRAVAAIGRHRGSVVLVGPRTRAELRFLRDCLPTMWTVGMRADDDLRHARWSRRRLRFTDTWEEREQHERAWGTGQLVDLCELIVDAASSTAEQLARVRQHATERDIGE